MDAVLEWTGKVSAARIHLIIDHRRLRASLLQLQELRGPGRCVNALAVAARAAVADRDGWMADAPARAVDSPGRSRALGDAGVGGWRRYPQYPGIQSIGSII